MAQLSETVKMTRIGVVLASPGAEGYAFNINIASDEIMVLQSLYHWWTGTFVAGINTAEFTLWRKTDSNPPGYGFDDSPDIVWHTRYKINFVTESINQGNDGYITFPSPLVLIRPPRLYVRTTTMTGANLEMRLYYILRKVSDIDLAKLMVKDHA